MGPKKGKEIVDENTWRRVIEEAPLDEEHWTVKVILIEAAGSDQDRIYLNKFETFAAQEKRFVIKNICKTETVFMVNQLGSDKKVKDENYRVFEEGNSYLKDKKDIPPDIFALIIKHLILKMKEEYLFIKRQRLDVKEGIRRESATMISKAEVKGTVTGVTTPGTATAVSPLPPPATPVPELPEGKKFNTLLRERGEEWRDKVYVDDYPIDGPNLYVALTGFVEPFLPGCLVRIGVPLTGVIQIRIDPNAKPVPPTLIRSTKRGQSQTEILTSQSLKFWDILQQLRIQKDSADDFKNTAFVVYSPPYWPSDDLSGEPDKIYDELCYLMYDIQDLSRQHLHYLENMDIIKIPEDDNDKRYQKHYHKLIDIIPLECITIYLLLDSILNTACKDTDLDDDSTRTLSTEVAVNPAISMTDKYKRSEYVTNEVFNTLCKTDADKKKYRLTYGEEYEAHKDPIVIQYGDFAKYNTFHLGNINLDKIVYTCLLGMPVHNLWLRYNRPSGEVEAKANFHVNVLLSCFDREDVETAELNRLLHILACRKLYNNRSSLKKTHLDPTTISHFKKVYLKRSVLAEPLPKLSASMNTSNEIPSFPLLSESPINESVVDDDHAELLGNVDDPETQRIKYLFDCPDISELVSAAEIANNQPIKHMIDDFDYFEDFSGISAFQMLCEAFNRFNCVDYKYSEVTDCFVLMFFNSHDNDGIARHEWRCHLSTPLCLQDFFDYILEEHYDWIKDEENLYDENLLTKAKSESKDFIDPSALKSCIEDNEVDKDLLMEGSLKQQEIIAAEAAKSEETEEMALRSVSSKKNTLSPEKSSRKTKSPASSSAKTVRKSLEVPLTDSVGSVEVLPKPFLGYDLGDRRVEVFGKETTFFSKDGTKVSTVYSLIIPMNLEYIILNITPGNSYNEFWIHKALGEFVKPEIIDTCDSFRITTKDQVLINIKKQTYQVPIPLQSTAVIENKDYKVSTNKLNDKDVPPIDQIEFEKKTLYSLFITWPNGMITETVHENNSAAISHIKQYNVSQMTKHDEEMRCISLNGEVIIFKTSGDIEVLRPDASFINITKYCKRPLIPETLEVRSEDTLEKGKKSKGKDKSSKASTKSSKNASSDDEKIVEEKVYEYELVIDEFDMISTNGLKQHYIDETPTKSEKLFIHTASNFCVGEVFSKRMDGTTILLNTNGIHVVTFPNKTRIITNYVIDDEEIYPEWTDEEKDYLGLFGSGIEVIKSTFSVSEQSFGESFDSKKLEEEETKVKERKDGYVSIYLIYTIEHSDFSTVTINKLSEKIFIDSPNETRVEVDMDNHYTFTLDNVTSADFNGENLNISYEACPQCRAYTNCTVKIQNSDESEASLDQNWVNIQDSHSRQVIIDYEGGISVMENEEAIDAVEENPMPQENEAAGEVQPEQDITDDKSIINADDKSEAKSESSVTSHGKCRELYLAKTIRFFILKR